MAGAHENNTPVIHRIPPFRPGDAQAGGARPARREVDPRRAPAARPARPAGQLPQRAARPGAAHRPDRPDRAALRGDGGVRAPRRGRGARCDRAGSRRGTGRGVLAGQRAVLLPDHAPRSTRCSATRAATRSTARAASRSPPRPPPASPPTRSPSGWVDDHLPTRRFDFAAHRYLARPTGVAAARLGRGRTGLRRPDRHRGRLLAVRVDRRRPGRPDLARPVGPGGGLKQRWWLDPSAP